MRTETLETRTLYYQRFLYIEEGKETITLKPVFLDCDLYRGCIEVTTL